MAAPVVMSHSRTYPFSAEAAFDGVLPLPLPELFNRRYGPIPAIKAVEGQTGAWDAVGQTRTIRLADGGSMREELTQIDRPSAFGYTLTNVTGPMKPLAARIHGLWSFDPDGAGTRITWQWTLHPASVLVVPILPIFRRLWIGSAKQAFQRIEDLLTAT